MANGHTDAVDAGFVPGADDWGEIPRAVSVCPYCGKTAPNGIEPSMFACCGEVGHAILVDAETFEAIDNENF